MNPIDRAELIERLQTVWRLRDLQGMELIAKEFADFRRWLIPDWKLAMLTYHMPEWSVDSARLPPLSGERLVEELRLSAEALTAPMLDMFLSMLAKRLTSGPSAALRLSGTQIVPVTSLIKQLNSHESFRAQTTVVELWLEQAMRLAKQDMMLQLESSEVTMALAKESETYSGLYRAIVTRDPSLHIAQYKLPTVLVEHLESVTATAVSVVLKITDVRSIVGDGPVDPRLYVELGEAVWQGRSQGRALVGCNEFCGSSNFDDVVANSTHSYMLDRYLGLDDFRQRHCRDAWFDSNCFENKSGQLKLTIEPWVVPESTNVFPVPTVTYLLTPILRSEVIQSRVRKQSRSAGSEASG